MEASSFVLKYNFALLCFVTQIAFLTLTSGRFLDKDRRTSNASRLVERRLLSEANLPVFLAGPRYSCIFTGYTRITKQFTLSHTSVAATRGGGGDGGGLLRAVRVSLVPLSVCRLAGSGDRRGAAPSRSSSDSPRRRRGSHGVHG